MNRVLGLGRAMSVVVCAFSIALPAARVAAGQGDAAAQQTAAKQLMPLPAKLQWQSGALKVGSDFAIGFEGHKEARLERAAKRFLSQLQQETGIVFAEQPAANTKPTLLISTGAESKPVQAVGEDESYTLDVSAGGAKLTAANPLGVLRGLQTLLQLVSVTPDGFVIPAVSIQDQPRFAWRGLMIDSARHFIPLDVVKRNLDGMEAVKMNVFHWHLSDNQGFRVESQKFPKLHQEGSDGLYYTQEEIRDLLAYARDRGIRVVPEFDMPGHSTAWFVGHPEIASGAGPYKIERAWGVFDPAMDPTNEKTYKLLNELIGEMAKLFPDQYFHIGGDEVNGKEWDANPKIQAYMKEHGLKNNEALQAHFSQRVQELVTKHGKTTIGWDEVLIPGVPKTVVIQSWRGPESLAAAAKQGYSGILSNGYYLDLGWTAARHYAMDPMGGAAASLAPEEKQRILGGESCIWSEYVGPENIDSRVWPRNAAIAERLWSPESTTDVASMYERMASVDERLEWRGLKHRAYQREMLQRMAGTASPEELASLTVLAEALEPLKEYTRNEYGAPESTSATPLNRMVDAVRLESGSSRRFGVEVDKFLAAPCKTDEAAAAKLKAQLERWASNDMRVQPVAARSFLVKDAAPASAALAQAAEIGLGALNRIVQGVPFTPEMKKQQLDALAAADLQAHKSQLILPMNPAIQKLIEVASAAPVCGLNGK